MARYPQGHGDAWGHYLTATKRFYELLLDPAIEWVVSAEQVLVGNQVETVGFQYERKFARAAAAKARAGSAITSLTFRQLHSVDPTLQDGYPDPDDAERAWGVVEWARRAGQAAYFDWITVNSLLDDEDTVHPEESVAKIDRTTVPEIREIAAAYTEIQSTLDNADAGLNPLGLATNVVPFGLNPDAIEQCNTHFEQVFERAVRAWGHALSTFEIANENTQRLRQLEDQQGQFDQLVEEREMDFNGRLIGLFGRPYPEDILPSPGGTYPEGYDGPDLYHFAYVDPSALAGLFGSSPTTTLHVEFRERRLDPQTGTITEEAVPVEFNVSTNGLGLLKPEGWGERLEPGEIHFARSEVLQALGRYVQALDRYEAHLDQIDTQADLLDSLYALNRHRLEVMAQGIIQTQTLNEHIRNARAEQLRLRRYGNDAITVANAYAEALPIMTVLGLANGGDFTSCIRSAIRLAGSAIARIFNARADNASLLELQRQQDLQLYNAQQQIEIAGWDGNYQVAQQVAQLEQLVRATPGLRLDLYMLEEAVNQATGRYHSALGRAMRVWEQRTAFRARAADDVTEYRFRDMAFRLFRNDALQKYRGQFDRAARYVYLAARAYDYETNRLDNDGGRRFLEKIVQQRILGGSGGSSEPQPGNGLAGQLYTMSQNFADLKPQLGICNTQPFEREFDLRWELFRIPNGQQYDAEWRDVLRAHVVGDINSVPEYQRHCVLLCNPQTELCEVDPAIVIPIPTTIQSDLNFFGWPSMGDQPYFSTYNSIKMEEVGIRFRNYPGYPLNDLVGVYLVPAGADVMREPVHRKPRFWHLMDQTLPPPFPIGDVDYSDPGYLPWDSLDGGPAEMLSIRRYPQMEARPDFDPIESFSSLLIGRSVWNTKWMLIIPSSQLVGSDEYDGIDLFINGDDGTGVRDIILVVHSYGYGGG